MEDNIHKKNFEQFLRDTTDDFLMVPSRKVWYGIYNNMHPDRKWPSMAVCLLILTSVLYIGVSNNNSLSDAARKSAAENLSDLAKIYISEKKSGSSDNTSISTSGGSPQFYSPNSRTVQIPLSAPGNSTAFAGLLNTENSDAPYNADSRLNQIPLSNRPEDFFNQPNRVSAFKEGELSAVTPFNDYFRDASEMAGTKQNKKLSDAQIHASEIKSSEIAGNGENKTSLTDIKDVSFAADKKKGDITLAEKTAYLSALDNERSWREDHAFRNKPKMREFRNRASVSYYFTPSIGFRSLTQSRQNQITAAPSASRQAFPLVAGPMQDNKGFNLEVGASLLYSLSENVRLKSGLQANYTNYTSRVTFIGHPTQTELAVNNTANRSRSSVFSATPGSERLNKSNLQVSVPVGADFKIAGNHKIKWYIGATLQPTYILNGSGYVMSADENYYISEKSLLRKWNMNTAVEAFVSFKPSPAVTVTVGPQFRYQFLSSFKKEYNYSEKLYNTGIKVGIITGL